MAINKRGIFFTLIAVLMVGLFIVIFSGSREVVTGLNKAPMIKERVLNADDLLRTVESSTLERMMRASGIKAIDSIVDLVLHDNYGYLTITDMDEFTKIVKDVMLYGMAFYDEEFHESSSGVNDDDPLTNYGITTMDNFKLPDFIDKLEQIVRDEMHVELEVTLDPDSFIVKQNSDIGPWLIHISAEFDIILDAGLATWTRRTKVETFIHIDGFQDPYYFKEMDAKGFPNQMHLDPIQQLS